jgi:low affinity Fe/Cu permease
MPGPCIQTGQPPKMTFAKLFGQFASRVAQATGRPATFAICILVVLVWAASGPFFHYSDTWQLIINTGTTIVTFLMVFLIQNTQNRDGAAIQAKLDELIRSSAAQNAFIGIEQLTEEELGDIRRMCEARAHAASQADIAEDVANRKAAAAADRATS